MGHQGTADDGACTWKEAGQSRAAQLNFDLHAMSIAVCMQHSGVQDGNVALLCCLLTEQHAHMN
jgi:hypothetical protein